MYTFKRISIRECNTLGYPLNTLESPVTDYLHWIYYDNYQTLFVICEDNSRWYLWSRGYYEFVQMRYTSSEFDQSYQEFIDQELAANVEIMMRARLLTEYLLQDITIYIGFIGIKL